jgi:hypothetical protein
VKVRLVFGISYVNLEHQYTRNSITSVVMQGARRGESVYLLYVLTISGVALVCNLRSPFSYVSGSILSQNDILEFSLQTHTQSANVTAVKAKPGCLVIGRQDGSVCCYSLGKLAPSSPGKFSNFNLETSCIFICSNIMSCR